MPLKAPVLRFNLIKTHLNIKSSYFTHLTICKDEEVDELKTVVTDPILKVNKPLNLASSYRPISLLLCISKTYERLIKNRLKW